MSDEITTPMYAAEWDARSHAADDRPPTGEQQTMNDAIKPALTPEEWRVLKLWRAGKAIGGHVRGMVVLSLPDDQRPGAAACALYGQPGGFTQEDVDRLEAGGPELYGGLRGTAIEKEWWAFLDSVAARIAALLPPPPS